MSTEETKRARLRMLMKLVDEARAVFHSVATEADVDLRDTYEADGRRRHIATTLSDAKRCEILDKLIEMVDILDDEAEEEEFYPDALVELEQITVLVCQGHGVPESNEKVAPTSEPKNNTALVPEPNRKITLKEQHKRHLLEWVQLQVPPITVPSDITPWPNINNVGKRIIYLMRSPHGLQQALKMMETGTVLYSTTPEIRDVLLRAWNFRINRDGNAAGELLVWISAHNLLNKTMKGPNILSRMCAISVSRSMQQLREESGRQRLSTASMDEYTKLSGITKSTLSNLSSLGNRFDRVCNGHIGLMPFLPLVGERDLAQLKHKQCSDIGKFMDDEWAKAMCRLGQQIEAHLMGTGEAPTQMRILYDSRDDLCNVRNDDLLSMLEPWIGKRCGCVSYASLRGD